jgi:hypothetical protein
MTRKRIKFSEILPPTWHAVHTSGSGRKGATRWMIYDGADNYHGDLVRWMPEGTWSWQPYNQDGTEIREGTINDCTAEIVRIADAQ